MLDFFSTSSLQDRFHSFMACPLETALSTSSCASYQTGVWTRYRLVNPSVKSFLCSHTLRIKMEATHTYNVPFCQLAKRFTQGRISGFRPAPERRGRCIRRVSPGKCGDGMFAKYLRLMKLSPQTGYTHRCCHFGEG